MEDQNLDWMTQSPLSLLGFMHKMQRHMDKLLTKYDLDKIVKAKDHLDMNNLHL